MNTKITPPPVDGTVFKKYFKNTDGAPAYVLLADRLEALLHEKSSNALLGYGYREETDNPVDTGTAHAMRIGSTIDDLTDECRRLIGLLRLAKETDISDADGRDPHLRDLLKQAYIASMREKDVLEKIRKFLQESSTKIPA
jgi:hypothetical protein